MIYQNLYNLVVTYIFGTDLVVVGSWYELVSILIASVGSLFVMALPFILVWRIIKLFS